MTIRHALDLAHLGVLVVLLSYLGVVMIQCLGGKKEDSWRDIIIARKHH